MLYLEDFHAGTVTEFGNRTVTEEEIMAFATDFDPQPFHVNRDAALASSFGGIIASGWHTVSLTCRMFVDNFFNNNALMAASAPTRCGGCCRFGLATRCMSDAACWKQDDPGANPIAVRHDPVGNIQPERRQGFELPRHRPAWYAPA